MNSLSIKKLLLQAEEVGWYLLLFLLPVQTRHIFGFQPWGFIEWNAISLYVTDLLFAGLLVLWARRARWKKPQLDRIDAGALLLVVAAGLSVLGSTHQATSLYQWTKLIEGMILFWYVRYYALARFSRIRSLEAFLAGSVLQSIIAIAQFVRQMDGGLWFLGESILSPHLKGIASFYVSSREKIIRAYGTTPHPNILATYLALAIIGYWYYFLTVLKRREALYASLAGYALLLFAFLMTFSRTVIFGWALASAVIWAIIFFHPKARLLLRERQQLMILTVATAVILGLFAGIYWQDIVARFTISSDEEAVTLRLYYGKQAFHTGNGGWNWTGIGIGNFVNWFVKAVPTLPTYLYQPVHNIYLLAYSETGILGAAAFAWLVSTVVWRYVRERQKMFLPWVMIGSSLGILLFVGFFDHFSWTLQQGRLIWWTVLALAAHRFDA